MVCFRIGRARADPMQFGWRMTPSVDAILRIALAGMLATALSACASDAPPRPQFLSSPTQAAGSAELMEPINRSVFDSNQQFNHAVIYPLAKTYHDTVPEPVRDSIDAFAANLNEPIVFANNILQLRLAAATTTFGRFMLNSTLGVGGLIDIASTQGLARQTGDFGQTLYVWGFRNSEFIVVPVVGPTNVRDAVGNGVEVGAQFFLGAILPTATANVASHVGAVGTVASPVASLGKAQQMQELELNSLDFYSMMRSVVEQKRQAELRAALRESPLSALPGLGDDNSAETGSPLISPALSSPDPESPALGSPALQAPDPISPPAQKATPPSGEPTSLGWIIVIARPQPGE
jgi:phospholipid-binding lipoprotein MlaA